MLELYLKEKNCGIKTVVDGLAKQTLSQKWVGKKLLHITLTNMRSKIFL